ncbi:hypothetical protein AV530_012657 [Patagioenas fasciata monilis]|uniref:Uncharacterized protein n=1 Tax=Patagioenas fasciata monilis TaxID=372326 RepID=A0A1V4JC59_PATFA|nr:hypothetical protein AV530_012657 [Patagioenas fasciata monilis]
MVKESLTFVITLLYRGYDNYGMEYLIGSSGDCLLLCSRSGEKMCACISYPKKDKAFCPKEQIKGFTSCWMDANATNDELGMMRRCGKIEKVMKNKRCGNIKKAIQQGLVCNMVGKEQKAYFQSALGLFSLAGHFN